MEQIASPDRPAYVCYAIVTFVGLWVAYAKVNKLMASSKERWGFFETWLVFGAYTVVPVLLFWLLDFTNAVHDTSIFAALLVALGYRQILAGETKGLAVAGQFSSLWSPFETWANAVRDRIATKSKIRSDRLYNKLQDFLAQDPVRAANLRALAYSMAEDGPQLTQDLTALAAQPMPPGVAQAAFERMQLRGAVARCLQSIRRVNPEDYGYVLHQEKLINQLQYWVFAGNFLSHYWQFYGLFFIGVVLYFFVFQFFEPSNLHRYHLWRFQKPNATERDRFRTHEYLAGRIREVAASGEESFAVIEPLVRLLRFRDIDRKVAENIISLVLEFRSVGQLTKQAAPVLIEALRTENPDVRLRIHQALKDLRALAYDGSAQDKDLEGWVPSKSESAGDVEKRIKKYYEWWDALAPKEPAATEPSPTVAPASPPVPSPTP
jgi:hypothetical protein